MPITTGPFTRERRRSPIALLLHCGLPPAVGWSLAKVMEKASGTPFSTLGIMLLLGGIGSAYTVDRLIDSPTLTLDDSPTKLEEALRAVTLGFLCFTLFATLRAEVSLQVGALLLGVITLAYTKLKRLPFAKTVILAGAWTWACATLPFAGTENPPRWWTLDVILPLLLLLAGNGILCDLKDRKHDCDDDVPTLPALIGPHRTCRIVTGILLLSVALSTGQGYPGIGLSGAALALAAQFPDLMEREIIGPLIADSILILPGALIYLGVV